MKEERYVLWRSESIEEYLDMASVEFPDAAPEVQQLMAQDALAGDLEDMRFSLDRQYAVPIFVVMVGNNRMKGQEIPSANLRDCLYPETLFANESADQVTWYVDRLGDLRCNAIHHDGMNRYLYRICKDNASPSQIELLKEKLYRGIATRADITRVTRRLGDDIAKVYGFSIPRQRQAVAMER